MCISVCVLVCEYYMIGYITHQWRNPLTVWDCHCLFLSSEGGLRGGASIPDINGKGIHTHNVRVKERERERERKGERERERKKEREGKKERE